MLRQEGGPAQNVADHQGAVVLVLENGLHHVADDVAVPQVHSVFRHDDQGEVQPVGQLHQPPVHYGHKDPHVEENQPHLTAAASRWMLAHWASTSRGMLAKPVMTISLPKNSLLRKRESWSQLGLANSSTEMEETSFFSAPSPAARRAPRRLEAARGLPL